VRFAERLPERFSEPLPEPLSQPLNQPLREPLGEPSSQPLRRRFAFSVFRRACLPLGYSFRLSAVGCELSRLDIRPGLDTTMAWRRNTRTGILVVSCVGSLTWNSTVP